MNSAIGGNDAVAKMKWKRGELRMYWMKDVKRAIENGCKYFVIYSQGDDEYVEPLMCENMVDVHKEVRIRLEEDMEASCISDCVIIIESHQTVQFPLQSFYQEMEEREVDKNLRDQETADRVEYERLKIKFED